jgi:predicted PurR-regulated permease PerM
VTWWAWLSVFVVLFLASLLVLFLLIRSLWRKASALLEEMGRASEQFEALSVGLEQPQPERPDEPTSDTASAGSEAGGLAVFDSPAALRRARRSRGSRRSGH